MSLTTQNSSANLPAVLNFEGVELKIIDRDGLPWITAGDLTRALGYSKEGRVTDIYNQHVHEFSEGMSALVTLEAPKINVSRDSRVPLPVSKVRVFSPRGAHLIGMFARTAKAAAFRRWVLDVLDSYTRPPVPAEAVEHPLDTLRTRRILFMLDGYGRPTASAVADDAAVVRPADLPGWIADSAYFTREELVGVALAAMHRLEAEGGQHAIRNLLAELDENYLLVLESELILSLYGSPVIWGAAKRGGRHG